MKIWAIRGKNIASLEGEFAVDFTAEPLASSGLFAITGSTGSGKSTLLDALCLALFDKTPRMNRAQEKGIAVPDVQDKTLSQNDCRSLLRRGTAEGYAEVDFRAVDGENYRARWTVRRARGRSEGSLQATEMRLYNLVDGREEQGGKGEILRRISDLLGLSFDQFTRAVLLAQGDFATFLKAPEGEKAELLEKLTDSEIYSRISQQIYARHSEKKSRYDALLQQRESIPSLSEEVRLQLIEERIVLQERVKQSAAAGDVLKAQLRWLDTRCTLDARLKEILDEKQKLDAQITEAAPRQAYMARYDEAQEIRDIYKGVHAALATQQETQARRTMVAGEIESCKQRMVQQKKRCAEADSQLADLKLSRERSADERRKAADLDMQMVVEKQKLAHAEKDYEEKSAERKQAAARHQENTENIAKNTRDAAELSRWFEQQKMFRPIVERAELIQRGYDELVSQRKQLQLQQQQHTQLSRQLAEAETAEKGAQKECERLDAMTPSEVFLLRAALVEGEPCPVCGNPHHLYTAEQVESLRYDELEAQKKRAAEQRQIAECRVREMRIALGTAVQLVAAQTETEQQKREWLDAELLQFLPQWESEERLGERIAGFALTWKEKQKSLDTLHAEIESLQKILPEIDEKLRCAESAEKDALQARQTVETRQTSLLAERGKLLAGRSLQEVDAEYEQQLKETEAHKTREDKALSELAAQHEKQQGSLVQLEKQLIDLQTKITAGERIVSHWLTGHADFDEDALAEFFTRSVAEIADEKQQLAALHERATTVETQYRERTEALQRHDTLPEKPEVADPVQLQQQLDELNARQREMSERLADINASLTTDARNKQEAANLVHQLEKLSAEKEAWARLNELYGSADGKRFRLIAQGYTLDNLLIYANIHLHELSTRYTLQRVPDHLALQVCDNDMLGEVRSVHTLSGGESFLISLALALGLSSLSSYRMNIESLFIDEGFGSLDAETLSVAMDALERLQIQGRKIGVISHVAEMTERIPVQIQVQRAANGSSRIEVVEA